MFPYSGCPQAFCTPPHPLTELLGHLVTAFRASYGGTCSAPALLLPHALLEVNEGGRGGGSPQRP